VLLGSTTGRDGIGGVSVLASAGFGDAEVEAAKRPSVQVGDPFEEKRLIEACLTLQEAGLAVGVQDLGGAGLTCATSETAAKGGSGMDVNVAVVPRREPGMEPFEVMTSESQERMLAIVRPEDLDQVVALCERWEVRATVVGRVNTSGRLRILDGWDGEVLADVPASSLHDAAPLYDRPRAAPSDEARRGRPDPAAVRAPADCTADLLALLADPAWAYRQYDHQLFLNTVVAPGGDAAVLRLKAPGVPSSGGRGLAITVDGNQRWCAVDPRHGTAMVVAEATLNVACAGGRPAALVNCLNFGNPEHPEVMWQLSEAIDGMAETCRVLDLPVVGGNVSLYNESLGRDIDPTPVIGVVGIIDALTSPPPPASFTAGDMVLLLGEPSSELAGSRWAAELHGATGGSLPPFDPVTHVDLLQLVRDLVADRAVNGIHDVADGGLAVTLAEMATASGVGVSVTESVADHGALFSESASRVVVSVAPAHVEDVTSRATSAGVAVQVLGEANGDRLVVGELVGVAVADLIIAWRDRIPRVLGH
jgi:phosphoribosylformylglycinamidine synthase